MDTLVGDRRVSRFYEVLGKLNDTRRPQILAFYRQQEDRLRVAKGSKTKHQAWEGGYIDHLMECLKISEATYAALDAVRRMPFGLGSAQVVLLFHDIEKLFAYSDGLPEGFDKDIYLYTTLATEHGIVFREAEHNALKYVHGEVDDYDPYVRRMGPLAAFVHSCDILSARMWPDEGRPGREHAGPHASSHPNADGTRNTGP